VDADFLVSLNYPGVGKVRYATNVSVGGLQFRRGIDRIQSAGPVEVGFRLGEEQPPIRCEAEIVYLDHDVAGLRFTNLTNAQREALSGYITSRLGKHWYRLPVDGERHQ
jgi:hypothetical protein